jgi:DNA polymerase III subunit epsilon
LKEIAHMHNRARQSAFQTARTYWQTGPLFLDTETTGLDSRAEIVEICILEKDGSTLLDTLVKPFRRIPADVIQIHGITNDMVANAPSWLEVWPQVQAALSGRYVGVYNADFDMRMLDQTNRASGIHGNARDFRFFCIMKLYAQFLGTSRWQTLEAAGRQCGLALPNAHRAQADTRLAREVFAHIVGKSASSW